MNVKSSYCRMPPKADYWKYFTVQGLLALCQIEGCPKPTVSLGSAPKNGGKKRISKSSNILASQYSSSLQLLEVWLDTWRNTMQKSGVPTARSGRGPKLRLRLSRRRRWRVVRWRTPRSGSMMWGQARGVFLFLLRYVLERDISCVNSFSVQMLPDVPEPPVYWAELDPRAEASHRGIISQMLVDFQPLSLVQLLLISCCSSERLTFWVCASHPGSRDLSLYIYLFSHVYK